MFTFRTQFTHVLGLLSVEGLHVDAVWQDDVRVLLTEDVVGCHVEHGDDLGGISNELVVQVLVERLQVGAVEREDRLLRDGNLKR